MPDAVLINMLTYLQPHSFLPFAHVSRRFHSSWMEMKRTTQKQQEKSSGQHLQKGDNDAHHTRYAYNMTNPLAIGNLFQSSWNVCTTSNNPTSKNSLNTQLLKYYIENGYGKLSEFNSKENRGDKIDMKIQSEEATTRTCVDELETEMIDTDSGPRTKESSPSNLRGSNKSTILSKVMYESAMRGDIHGMNFMATHQYSSFDHDENICTMAAAAGQLKALMWLRGDVHVDGCEDLKGDRRCPWDPTEVHREAAENAHYDVVEYVERNSEGCKIQVHYGVGLPW